MPANCSINMDSTFKSCPRTLYQLYIIHIKAVNRFIFSTASEKLTQKIFKWIPLGIVVVLKQEHKKFYLSMVMIDFEKTA
ncbi:LOW QUALITY PROTEIN: hypothetical protein MXB_3513 [Myxobolus squamalis]|nr:LOW QUALITY PROTEIN: hypothetical protein MXB_3513 [Myxobolus squamalis]